MPVPQDRSGRVTLWQGCKQPKEGKIAVKGGSLELTTWIGNLQLAELFSNERAAEPSVALTVPRKSKTGSKKRPVACESPFCLHFLLPLPLPMWSNSRTRTPLCLGHSSPRLSYLGGTQVGGFSLLKNRREPHYLRLKRLWIPIKNILWARPTQ